ncbi:hypothetical protein OROMI_003743 [Orobanche minor]
MAIREIIINITTLVDDKAVMDFYRKCVRVVTGKEELSQINLSEFSEYKKFKFPVNVKDFCYYVKLVKGKEFITFVIDSGTLYLDGFRIMEGKFYLLGNVGLVRYKEALIQVMKSDEGPLPSEPRLLTSLRHYRFNYQDLEIGNTYPKLEAAAGKHRSEIDIGIKSLDLIFDRLMKLNEDD